MRGVDATAGEVTIESGMRLRQLNGLLEHAGRALVNLGDIDAQTVAERLPRAHTAVAANAPRWPSRWPASSSSSPTARSCSAPSRTGHSCFMPR